MVNSHGLCFLLPYAHAETLTDITADEWSKEIKHLKAEGYNAIRLAEPEPHLFYDTADKEGIFVIDGFNGKWNKKDKADMLRRDITQHTSVLGL